MSQVRAPIADDVPLPASPSSPRFPRRGAVRAGARVKEVATDNKPSELELRTIGASGEPRAPRDPAARPHRPAPSPPPPDGPLAGRRAFPPLPPPLPLPTPRPFAPAGAGDLAALMVSDLYQEAEGDLTPAQARRLASEQASDLRKRYGNGARFPQGTVVGVYDGGRLVAGGAVGVKLVYESAPARARRGPGGVVNGRALAYVSNVVVSRDYRRRGLARRVVAALENAARGWEVDEVRLTVETSNLGAVRLYRKAGFKRYKTGDIRVIKAVDGAAQEVEVPVTYMSKSLRGGLEGALANADWGRLAAAAVAAVAAGGVLSGRLDLP